MREVRRDRRGEERRETKMKGERERGVRRIEGGEEAVQERGRKREREVRRALGS